jgi:uncharacterized protein (DUF4415 family)
MPLNSHNSEHTPVKDRKGIRITDEIRELYKNRDTSRDSDPDYHKPLSPEKWATAMRRDELFRPVKKQTTIRLDADILEWLKSKGQGHLTRINEILRRSMTEEMKQGNSK